MNLELVLFIVFAVATVISAGLVIGARSPISSAMSLVATFFFLAGIYVLLWAHTIAVLQVLVYAGAIMVLFLFVIMLLSMQDAGGREGHFTLSRIAGGLASVGILFLLIYAVATARLDTATLDPVRQLSFGTLAQVGRVIYTQWLLPFEAVSLLLLVAIVGAVVVAKSRI